MKEYDIPLGIKISNKEYDKLKEVRNRSQYVRDAINSYYGNTAMDIEISKKNLLKKLRKELEIEQKRYNKKMEREFEKHERRMFAKLDYLTSECYANIDRINKEFEKYDGVDLEEFSEESFEEKVLSILPTLKGIYNSDFGPNYDILRKQAKKIHVHPAELKDWVDDNEELLRDENFRYEDRIKGVAGTRIYKFE